jgi:SAM-dependent methyltransferase
MNTGPAAYDDFAWIYDRHWGAHAARTLEIARTLVLRDHPPPRRVLDVCCGTGQMAHLLQQAGYTVTGVDGSPEMIQYARRNAPGCELIVADVRAFTVPVPCDLALCMYDSLNHLMSVDDLRQAFQSVRGALAPGAPFLFDLNLREGYRERWRGSFGFVEDDHACVVRSAWDEPSGTAELRATMFRQRDGGWQRSDVALHQRCHSPDEVAIALAAAGFTRLRVLEGRVDLGLEKQAGRGYFLCHA